MYMRSIRYFAVVLVIVLASYAAFAQAPNLGKPITPAELAAWDINVLPDGTGLPPGSGSLPTEPASMP